MHHEGPPLEALTRRLAETPEELFAEPRIGVNGRVHVDAVVADLWRRFRLPVPVDSLRAFGADAKPADRNRLSVALLFCRLMAEESLRGAEVTDAALWQLLSAEAGALAAGGAAKRFVVDPERREEFARLALARLDRRPAGESPAQAQDRLAALNSAERARLLAASRQAEERARKLREALARKAAEEAADKWTRE